MKTLKLTLAAALLTLGLSLPSLSAETNPPSDTPSPQPATAEAAQTNELVSAPRPQQALPTRVESRPERTETRRPKSPAAAVPDLKIDVYDMRVEQR